MDGPGWRAGSRFGPYELRSLLGKGGMGEVYEAYDTARDRTVAVKLLPQEFANDPTYKIRFQRESQAAARLAEPHIIPINDWGVIDEVLFIDMHLVTGGDLRSILRGQGPMSPARTMGIIDQIASALDAAHAQGLVHRDVKPANILVDEADFAYLADFGLAHSEGDSAVTQVGMAVGSYIYMAPERLDVGPVTGLADIYSLACVLHECLTGATPFPSGSMNVLVRSHLTEPPPRPSAQRPGIAPALDEVIARGMAKDPAARYPTATALALAARTALSTSAVPVAPTFVVHAPDPSRFGQKSEPAPLSSLIPPDSAGEISSVIHPTSPTTVHPSEMQFSPLPAKQPTAQPDPGPFGPAQPPVPMRPFPDAHLFADAPAAPSHYPAPPVHPAPGAQPHRPVPTISEPPATAPRGAGELVPGPQTPATRQYRAPESGSFASEAQRFGAAVPAPESFAEQTRRYAAPVPAPSEANWFGTNAAEAGSSAAEDQGPGAVVSAPGSFAEQTRRYAAPESEFRASDPRDYDETVVPRQPATQETARYDGAGEPDALAAQTRRYDGAGEPEPLAAQTRRYDGARVPEAFAAEIQRYDEAQHGSSHTYEPQTEMYPAPQAYSDYQADPIAQGLPYPVGYGAQAGYGYGAPDAAGAGPSGEPGYGAPGEAGFGHPGDPGYGPAGDPGYGPAGDPGYGPAGDPGYGPAGDPGYGPAGDPGYGPRAEAGHDLGDGGWDDYADDYGQDGDTGPERRRSLAPILVMVGVVALVAAGVVAWLVLGSRDQNTGVTTQADATTSVGSPDPATPGTVATSAQTTTSSAAPTSVTLPSGAKTCSTGRPTPGSFSQTAAGSDVTSCPFAEAVRQSYAESAAAAPSRSPRSIVAVSPVTGRSYTMNCVAERQVVTCSGGENAVVYIY